MSLIHYGFLSCRINWFMLSSFAKNVILNFEIIITCISVFSNQCSSFAQTSNFEQCWAFGNIFWMSSILIVDKNSQARWCRNSARRVDRKFTIPNINQFDNFAAWHVYSSLTCFHKFEDFKHAFSSSACVERGNVFIIKSLLHQIGLSCSVDSLRFHLKSFKIFYVPSTIHPGLLDTFLQNFVNNNRIYLTFT